MSDSVSHDYRAAINSLFDHTMREEELPHFQREIASTRQPLTPAQARILPSRAEQVAMSYNSEVYL
jgi:hypothetical protein